MPYGEGVETTRQPDALLVLSFGGPEREEDVIPFLENVTRGRGIPRERLRDVGEHYYALGGRSPLNDLNREMVEGVRSALHRRGSGIPVYFGNRNWHPFVESTVETMARDGIRSAAVFATSAWGGYSGCRQYHEDIARARRAVVDAGLTPPGLHRLPQFHDHPLFTSAFARAVDAARQTLGPDADLVFTAHSVPDRADRESGPPTAGGRLYSPSGPRQRPADPGAQLLRGGGHPPTPTDPRSCGSPGPARRRYRGSARTSATTSGRASTAATPGPWSCAPSDSSPTTSRCSGTSTPRPRTPRRGLGVDLVRAATPGPTSDFAEMVVDLTLGAGPGGPGQVPNFGVASDGAVCAPGCCGS
jgi:ferrochelatase